MADGAACFRQDSSGPALLRVPLRVASLPVQGFHPLWPAFPDRSGSKTSTVSRPYNPGPAVTAPVWAPPRSLATTWGIIRYFLLLRVLRCFSSPGSPPYIKDSTCRCWVVPFGNPRIKGYLHLPGAYRSLSRPSSPLRARASPVRS